MENKSRMTKQEQSKLLGLLALGRDYAIDIIAAGRVIAEARLADAIGNDTHASELRRVQFELHQRIQNAEIELVKEIAKNV